MRIDKYLQMSRIIKRRVVAKKACDSGCVFVNELKVGPSDHVKVNDVIKVRLASRCVVAVVLSTEVVVNNKDNVSKICRIIENLDEISL